MTDICGRRGSPDSRIRGPAWRVYCATDDDYEECRKGGDATDDGPGRPPHRRRLRRAKRRPGEGRPRQAAQENAAPENATPANTHPPLLAWPEGEYERYLQEVQATRRSRSQVATGSNGAVTVALNGFAARAGRSVAPELESCATVCFELDGICCVLEVDIRRLSMNGYRGGTTSGTPSAIMSSCVTSRPERNTRFPSGEKPNDSVM